MDSLKSAYLLLVSITIILILCGFIIFFSFDTWGERGSFGDMFGSINALFSGLALAGVIYAILLQRKELSLQREELKLTRKELEKSAEAQEKSSKLLETQVNLMLENSKIEFEKREREADPIFILKPNSVFISGTIADFTIQNIGANISSLKIESLDDSFKITMDREDVFPKNQFSELRIKANNDPRSFFQFRVYYNNELGIRKSLDYEFHHNKGLKLLNPSANK
ncbi:MAG: hypothetical protein RIC57_11055 [Balneola sp.]